MKMMTALDFAQDSNSNTKMMNVHLEAGLRYIKVLPLKSFEVLKQIAVQKIQCMEAAK